MDQQRAIRVFRELEEPRYEDPGYDDGRDSNLPIWDVRLDAYSGGEDEREFRIRVKPGWCPSMTQDAYRDVLDIAEREGDLTITLENDGLMLR